MFLVSWSSSAIGFCKSKLPWHGLADDEKPNHLKSIPFYLVHVIGIGGLFFVTHSWKVWAVCIALYFIRMFFVTGVFHRYFSHQSYKMPRWFQFLMAAGTTTCAQKSATWWAFWHRVHHKMPDRHDDPHDSNKGFYWAHIGWILCSKFDNLPESKMKDKLMNDWIKPYPELKWLFKLWMLGPIALGVATFYWGGLSMLIIGFFTSTVLLYHGTFSINSLAHIKFFWSKQKVVGSGDIHDHIGKSQNNWLLAFLTMGEGWHNDHHNRSAATKQGDEWWKIDMSYYILWLLSIPHLTSDIKRHSDLTRKSRLAA